MQEAAIVVLEATEWSQYEPVRLTRIGRRMQDADCMLEAIKCYRKAIEIDPNFQPAQRAFAAALVSAQPGRSSIVGT